MQAGPEGTKIKNVTWACVGALAHTMAAVTSGTWEVNVGYEWVWL